MQAGSCAPPVVYMGIGDLKSGPHIYIASGLPPTQFLVLLYKSQVQPQWPAVMINKREEKKTVQVGTHSCDPSAWEGEAGGAMSLNHF